MELPPMSPPQTPTFTSSNLAHLSPPLRKSMEDEDSSVTRKRPRLDSGDRTYRSMSTDPTSVTQPSSEGQTSSFFKGGEEGSIQSETTHTLPQIGTPSKVTINVRDSGLISSPSQPAVQSMHLEERDNHDTGLASSPDLPSELASSPFQDTLTSKSPTRSPEIEVAELEDIDDFARPTVWKNTASFQSYEDIQQSILETFPGTGRQNDHLAAISDAAQSFARGDLRDHQLLNDCAEWIENYLEQTKDAASQTLDILADARNFWDCIPQVVDGILFRSPSRFDVSILDNMTAVENDELQNGLRNFLTACSALSSRMIHVDIQCLLENVAANSTTINLISPKYLQAFNYILQIPHEMPLFKVMATTYAFDQQELVKSIFQRNMLQESQLVEDLGRLTTLLLDRTQTQPEVLPNLWPAVLCLHRLSLGRPLQLDALASRRSGKQIAAQFYHAFGGINSKLETFVTKQVSTLSLDTCKGLASQLHGILRCVIFMDDSLAKAFIPGGIDISHGLDMDDLVEMTTFAWKFELMRKCILHGRFEIRIQGVESMQEDLVNTYQRHISGVASGTDSPVVQYLCDFILDKKLVNYLVGVESHPQLIQRSKNIVGFLVVALRYTDAETDVIWNALSTSQDSRTIDAMLEMLSGILNLTDNHTLVYICQKLIDLPISYFDSRMIHFARAIINVLLNKRDPTEDDQGVQPYNLLIRLVRAAASDVSIPAGRKSEIWASFYEELPRLLKHGPSDTDRRRIYEQCFMEVRERSAGATGSIAAINAFLDYCSVAETEALEKDFGMAELVVHEFSHFSAGVRNGNDQLNESNDTLGNRHRLFQKLLLRIPESFGEGLIEELWNHMIGDQASGDAARDHAWLTLSKSLENCQSRNPFFEACVRSHIPALHARYLTPSVLGFIESYGNYETHVAEAANDDILGVDTPGIELFWHVALRAIHDPIGCKAIAKLMKFYFTRLEAYPPRDERIHHTHIQTVERCINQLTEAASHLKKRTGKPVSSGEDTMTIVPTEYEIVAQRICFTRSLAILKRFIHLIRSQQPLTPAKSLSPTSHTLHGAMVSIRYQPHSGAKNPGIKCMDMGDLSTLGDLVARLSEATGFASFIIISGGRKVDQLALRETTLQDLQLHSKGLLLLQKTRGVSSTQDPISTNLRPLEIEVVKHFNELYELLTMDWELGKDVLDFLVTFPPHQEVATKLFDGSESSIDAFPTDSPCKTIYSVYALRISLSQRFQQGVVSPELLSRCVRLLTSAVIEWSSMASPLASTIHLQSIKALTEYLVLILKEPMAPSISYTYFDQPRMLVEGLQRLITMTLALPQSPETTEVVQACFCAILNASMHSGAVWQCFSNHEESHSLLKSMLLETSNEKTREAVKTAISDICGDVPFAHETTRDDLIIVFWKHMAFMIEETVTYAEYAEQFFAVATEIFRHFSSIARAELPLLEYLHDWSKLLLNFKPDEFVGRSQVDHVVSGLTDLMSWCMKLLKSEKQPITIELENMIEAVFKTHLFPEVYTAEEQGQIKALVPVLHFQTRGKLYDLVISMASDSNGFKKLLQLVKNLLTPEVTHYEPNWSFERMKAIRSTSGYAGMRNLSNTCYLNSLFVQLFMNVRFRHFMLGTPMEQAEGSQALLHETKALFAQLQETWLKAADPQGVAEAVVTYEGTPIDVTIQMDVDEFYNLLFDRWESQILSADDKNTFRGIYGGQIVQQIKSKECQHVSERLEPFSAIQCDIAGKATLLESLSAYVGGEVMEGDNKYSCSSCGAYLNAVKRACLKDIPDNLIFHLKRFDYDVVTGMRNKINESFEFPMEIDMSPYHVDHLRDPHSPMNRPDVFRLVGILVHSGNAESGHYYSYIRERPTDPHAPPSWVEFNDADVSSFDPGQIPDQCFGGLSDPLSFSGTRFLKTWSAYMLFYQRAISMDSESQLHASQSTGIAAKCEIPLDLANQIAIENETWIRKYCLFGPEHANFVRMVLEQYAIQSKGVCSDDHDIERQVITFTMSHLEQVLSRAKETDDFHKVLDFLGRMAGKCVDCCKMALEWVAQNEFAMRNLLLRSPDETVRHRFSQMIYDALGFLRLQEPRYYGQDSASPDHEVSLPDAERSEGVFAAITARLKELSFIMHLHAKGWEEYYGLLSELSKLGRFECRVLHEQGFLTQCLELLVVECADARTKRLRTNHPHLLNYVRLLEKGRRFSLRSLMFLLNSLLAQALQGQTFRLEDDDDLARDHFRLKKIEEIYLRLTLDAEHRVLAVVDKAIVHDRDDMRAAQEVIRILLQGEQYLDIRETIYSTICAGVNVEPASHARPYLHAAIAYCDTVRSPPSAREMVQAIAKEVDTINNHGGEDHLEFFARARLLRNNRLSPRKADNYFAQLVLSEVPLWAPTLLVYPSSRVREETLKLLAALIFNEDVCNSDDEEQVDKIATVAKRLCKACLKKINDQFIVTGRRVDGRVVQDIIKVVDHCLSTWFSSDADDGHDAVFAVEGKRILQALEILTVTDPEDALSEGWDSSYENPTDSESEIVNLSP